MYELLTVTEEYRKATQKLIDVQLHNLGEDADILDAEELEAMRATIEAAEAGLAFQIAMAEKIDQINDKLDVLLGRT